MTGHEITSRFNEIYNSTQKAVLSFVTAKCGNTADIADIVQETYLELYSLLTRRGVDYIKNEKAMVLKIAKQKLARHFSLMERLRMIVPMFSTNADGDEIPLTDLEADAFLEEDFTVNQLLIDDAKALLRHKPENVRKVFYLYYEVGLSIPEISKTLSISESDVKNKLYRTLKELRSMLL
jgi:RNA polymerase sigma-70 factor (ECF subfamily)